MPPATSPATTSAETTPPAPAPETPSATPTAITHGSRKRPEVAITLDADFSPEARERVRDGRYGRQVNEDVIKILELRQVAATVFVTGMWAEEYPDALARLSGNPRIELANHTWDHRAWSEPCYGLPAVAGANARRQEITKTNAVVAQQTGRRLFYFRFPGLCHTPADLKLVADAGMQAVDTDVLTDDAFAHDAKRYADEMLAATKPGSILLLHLNGPPNAPVTAEILGLLLRGLRDRHLTPVLLSELLRP